MFNSFHKKSLHKKAPPPAQSHICEKPVGAAAIAATFNTPLAAVVYSLEEIAGDPNAPVLGSVVLASATSWLVLRLLLGNNSLFVVPQYQLVHPPSSC